MDNPKPTTHIVATHRKGRRRIYKALKVLAWVLAVSIPIHVWFHLTNPYVDYSVVKQPYATVVGEDGQIDIEKQYDMRVYSNPAAQLFGYHKSIFLIAQTIFQPSLLTDTKSEQEVLDHIHKLRFDPSKPYLISGNQFSVLYPRNLGVFYNSLLDPRIATSQQDWEKRQRIYFQSAMLALNAFSKEDKIRTTIVPIGPKDFLLTQVHPGSKTSDTLYGVMYAFKQLSTPSNKDAKYKIQTTEAARRVISERRDDFARLVDIYLDEVQDPETGLIKRHIKLSSARDGVLRDSSFYDNIVMWSTIKMADEMGIRETSDKEIADLRQTIIDEYWDEEKGIFADEFRETTSSPSEFSADWLLALPTGFLDPANLEDRSKLERMVAFVIEKDLDKPLPIKYTTKETVIHTPAPLSWFESDYGGSVIWSYWGAEYITLLNSLYAQTNDDLYQLKAYQGLEAYKERMERYGGFAETYSPDGTFFETLFYESIVETGWVVQYERARLEFVEASKDKPIYTLD